MFQKVTMQMKKNMIYEETPEGIAYTISGNILHLCVCVYLCIDMANVYVYTCICMRVLSSIKLHNVLLTVGQGQMSLFHSWVLD